MRDYQSRAYKLPHDEYMQVLWFIRGYDRRQAEAEAVIEESPAPPDGMPKGNGTSDPVAAKVAKRERLLADNQLIKSCLEVIPGYYRRHVWNNVMYRSPYPHEADKSTYSRWRVAFITEVYARKFQLD